MPTPTIFNADCLAVMALLPDSSVDAIVTDPPYGLGFMGKAWDDLPPGLPWARECLRVLKPGGHLLAFGGTRTWHRLACAVEDAGFEMRDSIAWLYGSGFPKSLDVSKAIDKAAGAEREVVGTKIGQPGYSLASGGEVEWGGLRGDPEREAQITAPATEAAQQWQGWGTALKPAFEPIVVARKPLVGTVAANVLAHGTGALNIDGCRIGSESRPVMVRTATTVAASSMSGESTGATSSSEMTTAGRWPANVVLDSESAAALDAQSGTLTTQKTRRTPDVESGNVGMFGLAKRQKMGPEYLGDSGGASRFFYVAKAPKSERPVVWMKSCNCETMKPCQLPLRATTESASDDATSWSTSTSGSNLTDPYRQDTTSITEIMTSSTTTSATSNSSPSSSTSASTPAANSATANGGSLAVSAKSSSPSPASTGTSAPKAGPSTVAADPATSRGWSETSVCGNCGAPARKVAHETVKPLALMRWLVRLVTPPGGIVLDPFAGSGTTVEAALLEGFDVVGIEREPDYAPLIQTRIDRALGRTLADPTDPTPEPDREEAP